MKPRAWYVLLCAAMLGSLWLPLTVRAAGDEFFIVTSVDLRKREMVLKMPTEVTVIGHVSPETIFLDEQGRRIRLADLHAGDTVYATYRKEGNTVLLLRVRKGPMTVEELHRRYLHDRPAASA